MTAFRLPALEDLKAAADRLGLAPSGDCLRSALAAMAPIEAAYRLLDEMDDGLPAAPAARVVTRPRPEDNRRNAWTVRTSIIGHAAGPLAGKRIAIKDNMCVAGLPMAHGGALSPGYVPEIDATVVTRILEAGGEITGKTTCEWGCISGGSHTSFMAPSPIRTMQSHCWRLIIRQCRRGRDRRSRHGAWHRPGWVDQDPGQLLRCLWTKTDLWARPLQRHRLTGGLDRPLRSDRWHVGDNAILLDAIAGPDGLDERPGRALASPCTAALEAGVRGRALGSSKKSFGAPNADPEVDEKVLAAARRLETLGAALQWVSVLWHLKGTAIWAPITHEGGYLTMWASCGLGAGPSGLALPSLAAASAAWREDPAAQAPTTRVMMLFGSTTLDRYRGAYYAKARNLRRNIADGL